MTLYCSFALQFYIQSYQKNGELAILDERTYWIMEDQVKQLLSLEKSGILVSWVIQGQINRLCIVCDVRY